MNKYTPLLQLVNESTANLAHQIMSAKMLRERLKEMGMDPCGAECIIVNLTNSMGAAMVLQKGIIALDDKEEEKLAQAAKRKA